ncbi:hypothetical protein SAMN04489727_6877 [Amycolatopsis tolypomycina]|uniref:Uncharacterized protein n=1 Tax=Amycolatopsis tolypomycina TaxID=208445 RepID=A0A1H4YS81_9PSEU|nr:hypothetical protein [Amycolatopsis tolypomycina]SED20505.1 hypothetical protein SAMN04489727_6877 [Amycolatopsis tolypomycina]
MNAVLGRVLVENETEVARTYLDRVTELGLRRAARMIGLKSPSAGCRSWRSSPNSCGGSASASSG